MAQEIQRKLEETEVKQRELESRGVGVEKALRGEGGTTICFFIGIPNIKSLKNYLLNILFLHFRMF